MSITNKNTMYIVVAAVVIIIVIASVAAYVFLYSPSGSDGGDGGGNELVTMGNATSLQYNVNVTDTSGTTGVYMFAGNNLGTANIMLRVDVVGGDTIYSYLLFAGNQTSWNNATGTWAAGTFVDDWTTWSTQFEGYIDHNEDWKAGDSDITYTADGNSIVIYDISINPTLADSFFQPM